jgi:hypothetical protein
MSNRWSSYSTIIIFIVITALGFILWVGGLFVFWLVLRLAGISTDFWAMCSALSTAVAAAGLLGAGFVAYRELAEVASSRHLDVANQLFEELNSPENILARRWVFQNLPADPAEGLHSMTPEGQAAVKQVLNSLDHVSFLTQAGWIPEELVMPWMHPMIAKSWEKLEPYVKYERVRRNEPYYYRYAGELAERCLAWRAKHHPGSQVAWVEEAL